MCNICESGGWKRMVCNVCGISKEHTIFISILIALDNEDDFPYSQTTLCKECWEQYGVESAFEHNEFCRT
jgi:hypothetical protein